MDYPDKDGKYMGYGGRFIPEALMEPLLDLEETYLKLKDSPDFKSELDGLFKNYVGRPTALSFCDRLSKKYGAKIYLKREDLAHTGAHKINNALGQGLIAKKMGKKRMIAETGAGQHGVATATAGAKLGLETEIYMGTVDMERQSLNVFRMELLGSNVIPVESGSKTLKDAINEAFRDWVASFPNTHYLFGSVLGPHPYPMIVRDFQSIIGKEIRTQILELEGRLPDHIVACVGGGSNAMGAWYAFLDDKEVDLVGVEAGGRGIKSGEHAARFADPENGRKGVFQGSYSFVLQDKYGQINNTHSISAGLDYSAVGPEHSMLRDIKRARYSYATDDEVIDAVKELCREEGILPALESAHAVAHGLKMAREANSDEIIVINLSGRGDKDVHTLINHLK